MAQAPNHKKLVVTNKSKAPPKAAPVDYPTDMRTIEQWANSLPVGVEQIIAGTDITISPTDGEGIVTINSTGGGGGSNAGLFELLLQPDSGVTTPTMWLSGQVYQTVGETFVALQSNSTGSSQEYTFAGVWIAFVTSGQSAAILPEWTAPAFTGPDLVLIISGMEALDYLTFTNYAQAAPSNGISIPSGGTGQFATTDFPGGLNVTAGTDLSFVNGTGNSGNGIVSAGTQPFYLVSIAGSIVVSTGTTFT